MAVYACLILGRLGFKNQVGSHDIKVCTVRYVRASDITEAKKKSIDKFLHELRNSGEVSNEKMLVEKVQVTKFWALWSKQAWFAWDALNPKQAESQSKTIKKTIEYHRYIS